MTPNNNIDEMVRMAMEKGAINYDDRKRMIEALTRHGTDADEAELLLDAAIQKAEQQQREHSGILRCPRCGTVADAFAARCPVCGHEFRDTQALNVVQELYEKLFEAERQSSNRNEQNKRKEQILKAFQLPDNREELLEFLAMAVPNAKKQGVIDRYLDTYWKRFVVMSLLIYFVSLVIIRYGLKTETSEEFSLTMDMVGTMFVSAFYGIPIAHWWARKVKGATATIDYNLFAPIWRDKAQQALQKLRPLSNGSGDDAIIANYEKTLK